MLDDDALHRRVIEQPSELRPVVVQVEVLAAVDDRGRSSVVADHGWAGVGVPTLFIRPDHGSFLTSRDRMDT